MRLFLVTALASFITANAAAQTSEPQIWNGVFSAAQAERGREVVIAHCTQCHGQTRSLTGDVFMLHWEGHDLGRLYRKIKDTMPPGRVAALTDAEKLDALAYMLQQNGFPAGAQDLPSDDALLKTIRILPRGGPRPMQSGAVVQVTGCLAAVSSFQWQLTSATEPAPAVLDDTGDARADAGGAPGTQTFQLLNAFPSPAPHVGHRVEVKGLLIRNPAGDRINVVSLKPMGEPCAP